MTTDPLRPLSASELAAFETKAKAATPGLWTHETHEGGAYGEREYSAGHVIAQAHTYAGNSKSRRDSVTAPDSMTFADGEYIAACSPDVLLRLLAQARSAWRRNELVRLESVTRLEVINESGRIFGARPCHVDVSLQDEGRTLKVFVKPASPPTADREER